MIYLRQSTASQEIPLGYFVDSTDGDTAETGLTIANTDIKVWKTGATTLANKTSGGATHIAGGLYYAVLDATDTDTIGPLVVFVHVAGALAVKADCCVLAAVVYDVQFGTVAPATATNITAGTIATVTNRVTANADQIAGVAAAATRLALSAGQIIPATVDTATNTHTPTTTVFQADDITEATADHFNGCIVIWTSGALVGQRTSISDYVAVGGIGQFTVVAMTEAPANNDTFIIV